MRPSKSKRQYKNFAILLKIRKKINPLNRLTKEWDRTIKRSINLHDNNPIFWIREQPLKPWRVNYLLKLPCPEHRFVRDDQN